MADYIRTHRSIIATMRSDAAPLLCRASITDPLSSQLPPAAVVARHPAGPSGPITDSTCRGSGGTSRSSRAVLPLAISERYPHKCALSSPNRPFSSSSYLCRRTSTIIRGDRQCHSKAYVRPSYPVLASFFQTERGVSRDGTYKPMKKGAVHLFLRS